MRGSILNMIMDEQQIRQWLRDEFVWTALRQYKRILESQEPPSTLQISIQTVDASSENSTKYGR